MTTNKITHMRPSSLASDPRSRRARLDTLLDIRWRMAKLAVERRSHNLDDAIDTFHEQLLVESTIDREFPGVVDEKFGDWIEADARLEHDAGFLHPDCGICQAIAQRAGITFPPQYAA